MEEPNEDWSSAIDAIRDAAENERLPRKVRDLLESELDADEIQSYSESVREPVEGMREQANELEAKADRLDEVADAYSSFADAVNEALDNVNEWEEAEGREEKREARETLLNQLVTLTEAYDETTNYDLDEMGVLDSYGPKVACIVWEDGQPKFVDGEGNEIPWPEQDAVWAT